MYPRISSLILIVVTITAAPSVAGIFFETSWNMETGNSNFALTDGYRFNGGCYGNELLKVETGGIAGNNLMGVWLNGEQYAHTLARQLPILEYSDLYYRLYVRVYPKNGISYPNFHGIQNYEQSYPDNFYFSVRDQGDPNSWTCAIGSYAAQPEGMDGHYLYHGALAFNQWYRVEGHIHWYNHVDWASPTKWELRVYDTANRLVLDESQMKGWGSGKSLTEFYSQGKRLYLNGNTTTWSMGTNGPAGGSGQGRVHDISCVALGSDASAWGPVTAKLPLDNLAPKASGFFPKAGATNVAASTVINLALTDAGFGMDTGSIVLKVNGVAVKPNRSGTAWAQSLFYKPPVAFAAGTKVTVEVNARDVAVPANAMVPVAYSFMIAGTPAVRVPAPRGVAGSHRNDAFNLLGQRTGPMAGHSGEASRFIVVHDGNKQQGVKQVLLVD